MTQYKTIKEAIEHLNARKEDKTGQQRTIFANDTFEHFSIDSFDDYTYEFLGDLLNHVHDNLDYLEWEEMEDTITEWADSDIDIYTHNLCEWAKRHHGYCDGYANASQVNSLFKLMQYGQYDHRSELYHQFFNELETYLEDNCEECKQ